ncbi:FAD-dependent oxidoreductase [Lentzea sp. BCCO 10_0061]|uniref:FAD-dependent oxidoreductase n=1 Tax=Lentzea sokolovensis TaxID=3095429 RepID=A0ABU4UQX9_9PSEU|nr:FAD-dependent oxidoreductase [Lentzea sp. BCCO 10_0061]MDX8141572.1 FAD-dependent oxidoreductase [Lentzea sp. BCCO 10_0061]
MKICVIGSGITGLTVAFQLSRHRHAEVVVYEREHHFGGRADVASGGEHCPRFFMEDYSVLFDVLRQIDGHDGPTVFDDLQLVRRFSRTSKGWVEISHLYRVLAREVPVRDRLRVLLDWRPSPLIAEPGLNENRFASPRNYRPASIPQLLSSMLRSRKGYVFPGATDDYLINPWVRHLEGRGVTFQPGTPVSRIRGEDGAVIVTCPSGETVYDAVVVTAFVPDTVNLLNASKLDHTVVEMDHTHCVAYTMRLAPDEPVLDTDQPTFYCNGGVNVLVQPRYERCVVLCTNTPRTDPGHVVGKVREILGLRGDVLDVRVRTNQRPNEAVYAGEHLHADRLLRRAVPGVYFAGSAMRTGYPVDSAESAARSALAAVQQVRKHLGLLTPAPAVDCSMTDTASWGRAE